VNSQLFHIVRGIELPLYREPEQSGGQLRAEALTASFAFNWPNGLPCAPVEMYLLDLAHQMTVRSQDGGSLKTKASQLTHLIRFCFDEKVELWELDDISFRRFVTHRLQKPTLNRNGFKSRNNNTNLQVIDTCLAFLRWAQEELFIDRVIVGTRYLAPQIRLIYKTRRGRDGTMTQSLVFPYEPQAEATEPKGPMPNHIRDKLWSAVSCIDAEPSSKRSDFRSIYLVARRELILFLLEGLGGRPDELVSIRIPENPEPTAENELTLPTRKRRRTPDPLRTVPTGFEIASAIETFVQVYRKNLVENLIAQGYSPDEEMLFLSARNGAPFTTWAIQKEFQRIVAKAGLEERACMSMFRHRFITIQVALHLRDYLHDHPETSRERMVVSDKISILTRVASITGHANPESLLPYINLAWGYLGVFKPVDEAAELVRLLHGSVARVRSLQTLLINRPKLTKKGMADRILMELQGLESRMRESLRRCNGEASVVSIESEGQRDPDSILR
jgi:integrase